MQVDDLPEPDDDLPPHRAEWIVKERAIEEVAEVLYASEEIANLSKLTRDLINAEKCTTTGIGEGIAIPHARTLRTRTFVMGFCRSPKGVRFGAVDGEPVHLFFPLVAPPYEDRTYLRVLRDLATIIQEPGCRDLLLHAESADEIIWGLQTFAP